MLWALNIWNKLWSLNLLAHVILNITESSCRPRWQQPSWLAQPAAYARLCFGTVLTSQHGAVFWNGNRQDRAPLKLFFERLRDRIEVRFSPLIFILIDRCENVLHEKLSRTPLDYAKHLRLSTNKHRHAELKPFRRRVHRGCRRSRCK